MVEYFKLALSKYAQFTGRSRRSEYWYFYLVNILLSMAVGALTFIIGETLGGLLNLVIGLGLFIPGLAVAVRRLHDVGRSGWWFLIVFTGIGALLLLYWLVNDSEAGSNEYGPNPKTGALAGDIEAHLVE
ncbi:DUF805 domain-containing protein [Neolewinella antarctica]|uniref:Uncharacterized membrane protein YhaH (DUF805 family) n=1 Tax=Neolewinella antarctica TaxID=442734 RepID=A0ABX0XGB5_9BACT|nr:DUF805 domain-containing protein [Neolewinella antarctica]NJC27828.1 uncharacterized membrane protein YhaH (DUF805 family) [Neolewinella antarctica]